MRSATLEAQEAALTGESAPIPKDPGVLQSADVALGDRTNMLFQNTSVTRGTATLVVTGTGMDTQMGQIATMLTSVTRTRSPLQRELDSLTKVLGLIAWEAVAVRGQEPHRRRDTRRDERHQHRQDRHPDAEPDDGIPLYASGSWFTVDGEGYRMTGALRSVAGDPVPDFTRLALGLVLDSDAVVEDDGSVIGDPTEAALVVLAAKLGVDAPETRRAYPRLAEVPFDSEYKFMSTFHRVPIDGVEHVIELVKGAPDVVIARCSKSGGPLSGSQVPMAQARAGIDAANVRMGEKGLRVLAFAARLVGPDELETMTSDPMALTHDLGFVGMTGIIDPLRAEARDAVAVALTAGIDVRMITGDHAVTAQAIGDELGLGPGAISGAELQALTDDQLKERLPKLHVFGRVTPEDKLRLARAMQETGLIVAMTGDAVNDAAALKQADIGVAMGSGSEVTRQAARMVLTDDNFGTLVHAVEIGRHVYDKIVSYVRYQMTQLLALVFLFLAATLGNVNQGEAMTPSMVLYLLFFATAGGVVIIAVDPGDPEVMHRPPRDPKVPITNRSAITMWLVYAAVLFVAAMGPLVAGPDEPSLETASVSMTMTFVVMGLGTVFNAIVNRRDPTSGLDAPVVKAIAIGAVPALMVFLATELPRLQHALLTTSLTGGQWLVCAALAALLPLTVEVGKLIRRRRLQTPSAPAPEVAVAPARARTAPIE